MAKDDGEESEKHYSKDVVSVCEVALAKRGIDPSSKEFKVIPGFDFEARGKLLPYKQLENLKAQYTSDQLVTCTYSSKSFTLGGAGFFVLNLESRGIVAIYLGR